MKTLSLLTLFLMSFNLSAENELDVARGVKCRLAQDNPIVKEIEIIVRSIQNNIEQPRFVVQGQFELHEPNPEINTDISFWGKAKYSRGGKRVKVKYQRFAGEFPKQEKLKMNLSKKTARFSYKLWPGQISLGRKSLKFTANLFCQDL
jgi:hypothetical protein